MKIKLIKNVFLILPERVIRGNILFSDKIERIFYNENFNKSNKDLIQEIDTDQIEVIDGEGNYLSPGFIDIHIHGAAGYDTMDGSYLALNEISKAILASGVTSFLPTTMTMPLNDIKKALENIRTAKAREIDGARLLGCHAEGPFINPEHKGAQPEKDIRQPDISIYEDYFDVLQLVTLAPELAGAAELIGELNKNGITVAAGHTAASFRQVIAAREKGLSHLTHLFNGMAGLHHRKPGAVGAALATDISCELIVDFIHLHPEVIRIVLRAKTVDDIILVTDQMRAGSLGEGEYDLGGQRVIVKNDAARLESGNLAGSVLTLDRAVKNIYGLNELTLPEVIKMVTLNPARLLQLDDRLGKIAEGYRADLLLLDKNSLEVKKVFQDGRERGS